MQYLVTDIEFDFNEDLPDYYSVSFDDQKLIINDNLGLWEATDPDDLIEEVTLTQVGASNQSTTKYN